MDFQAREVLLESLLPRYLVGVSSKMYFTHKKTIAYVQALQDAFPTAIPNLQLFFIPSFPSILPCSSIIQNKSQHILIGGQDCSSAADGAHTGSVSAKQLVEVGASLVELGHAERRSDPFNETNDLVAQKAQVAVQAGLVPLVCIGERTKGKGIMSEAVGMALREVNAQVRPVLDAVCQNSQSSKIIFAYEPVWAIGAEKPAEPDHVNAVVKEIRRMVKEYAQGKGIADGLDIKILYGGSAGPGTWEALKNDLDGLFLGRFAHNIDNVKLVVKEILG